MKKSLLLAALAGLLVFVPSSAQTAFTKAKTSHNTFSAKAPQKAEAQTMNNVVASYYTGASDATGNFENYYLIISNSASTTFDGATGTIYAKSCKVAAIDFYAPKGSGADLPAGTYKTEGDFYYDGDISNITNYNAAGEEDGGSNLNGDVTVSKNTAGGYTITFADAEGNTYSYSGTLSFIDPSSGTTVYPQIPTDINAEFTGGMAFYHGNLMESNTGNIYINLYDCAFDPETGGMQGAGLDLAICAYNRLFGDPKKATIIPGTYTVARNFKSETFFPGMEIDYNGMTVLMGTYVKRLKSVATGDYDYAYISDGTITITEGDQPGTFNFVIDCTTDRGHKVKGTAKNISFNIVDVSDDKQKSVESNLDSDVNLNLSYVKKARAYYLGKTNNCNVFTIDIGSPSGKDGETGDILRMEFQTEGNVSQVIKGTYELMEESHLYTNMYAPYRMTRGYFDNVGGRTGTRYEHFEDGRVNVVDKYAFVYSGNVGVEHLEDGNCKFNINLADGYGYLISGVWQGPVELQYDLAASISGVADDKLGGINFIDNNTFFVEGATASDIINVYNVNGQLCLTSAGNKFVNVNSLAKGVYVIKAGNITTTKFIKK